MATLCRVGLWRSKEGEQRLHGRGRVRCGADCRREHGFHLDLRWKQADDVDPWQVHQFAPLLEAQLDVAARHERAYGNAGGSLHGTWSNGVGDAPSFEQADQVSTARTGRIPDAAGL